MENWRSLFGTEYDKETLRVASLFTYRHATSDLGSSLDFIFSHFGEEFILVGGLARRFHSSPRNTGDIDLLFRSEVTLQRFLKLNIGKYTKVRDHAIKVNGTEVDLLSPEFLNIPQQIVDYCFKNCNTYENIKVANKEAIILLKLQRMSLTDDNDIHALIQSGGKQLKIQEILDLAGDKRSVIEKFFTQNHAFLKE